MRAWPIISARTRRYDGFVSQGYRIARTGAVFGYRADSELLLTQRNTGRGLRRFKRAAKAVLNEIFLAKMSRLTAEGERDQ